MGEITLNMKVFAVLMVGDSFLPAKTMAFSGDKNWSAGHWMFFRYFPAIYIFYMPGD